MKVIDRNARIQKLSRLPTVFFLVKAVLTDEWSVERVENRSAVYGWLGRWKDVGGRYLRQPVIHIVECRLIVHPRDQSTRMTVSLQLNLATTSLVLRRVICTRQSPLNNEKATQPDKRAHLVFSFFDSRRLTNFILVFSSSSNNIMLNLMQLVYHWIQGLNWGDPAGSPLPRLWFEIPYL